MSELDEQGFVYSKKGRESSSESTSSKSSEKNKAMRDVDDYVFLKPKRRKKKSSSHSHKHKSSKKSLKRRLPKIIIIVLSVLVGLVLALIITLAILIGIGRSEVMGDTDDVTISVPDGVENFEDGKIVNYNGHQYKYKDSMTTMLFMGIDKRDFDTGNDLVGANGDADVLILYAYDTDNGESSLVSVSRDTMADMDVYSMDGNYLGTKTQQLCLAYAYGDGKEKSCENQIDAVRKLFYNIPINSYLALDLDGISYINDSIGGVIVTPEEDFGEFTAGSPVTLYGKSAETYVRSRDTSQVDSNISRMNRQKQYINAFFNQAVETVKGDISTVLNIYDAASPYMITNLTTTKVAYIASSLLQNDFGSLNFQSAPGTTTMGETYAEFYIDETKFYEMFLEIYYEQIS